jgi:CheY-like chemotaxis protein
LFQNGLCGFLLLVRRVAVFAEDAADEDANLRLRRFAQRPINGHALADLRYRILVAPTGVKALEVWKENRDEISLLLTDLVMPDGMTGMDLAKRLLQESPKLKVIYMSGYSAELIGKDFPLAEDVSVLAKPFPAQKLAQTIRDRLDAPLAGA